MKIITLLTLTVIAMYGCKERNHIKIDLSKDKGSYYDSTLTLINNGTLKNGDTIVIHLYGQSTELIGKDSIVIIGDRMCNASVVFIDDTQKIKDTIPNSISSVNDTKGCLTNLQDIRIGDTVIVFTTTDGEQTGILRAEYQGHYWVNLFKYLPYERGWRTDYPAILPYNKKWEQELTKKDK